MTRANLIFVSFNITEGNYFNFLTPRVDSNFFRKSILFCFHISTVNTVLYFAKVTNNHLGPQNNVVGEDSIHLGYCAMSNCKYKILKLRHDCIFRVKACIFPRKLGITTNIPWERHITQCRTYFTDSLTLTVTECKSGIWCVLLEGYKMLLHLGVWGRILWYRPM